MSESSRLFLPDFSILVVEDSGFQAAEVEDILIHAGANVIGPAANLNRAMGLLSSQRVDAAVLDINLDGELIFPFARELIERDLPFLFLSGSHTNLDFSKEFKDIPCVEKPVRENLFLDALNRLLLA